MTKNILIGFIIVVLILGGVGIIAIFVQSGNNQSASNRVASSSSVSSQALVSSLSQQVSSSIGSVSNIANIAKSTFTTPLFPKFKADYDTNKWFVEGNFLIPEAQTPISEPVIADGLRFVSKKFNTKLEIMPVYEGAGGAGILCIIKNDDGSSNLIPINNGQSYLVRIKDVFEDQNKVGSADNEFDWASKASKGVVLPTDAEYAQLLLEAVEFSNANQIPCPLDRIEGIWQNSHFSLTFDKRGLPLSLQTDTRFNFDLSNQEIPATTIITAANKSPEAVSELVELLNNINGIR